MTGFQPGSYINSADTYKVPAYLQGERGEKAGKLLLA
jgi:hypothetical protein